MPPPPAMSFGERFGDVLASEYSMHAVPYGDLKQDIERLHAGVSSEAPRAGVDHGPLESSEPRVIGAEDVSVHADCLDLQAVEQQVLDRIQSAIGRLNGLVQTELGSEQDDDHIQRLTVFSELNRSAIVELVEEYQKKIGPSDRLRSLVQQLPEEPFVQLLETEPTAPASANGIVATKVMVWLRLARSVAQGQEIPEELQQRMATGAAGVALGVLCIAAFSVPQPLAGPLRGVAIVGSFLFLIWVCIRHCRQTGRLMFLREVGMIGVGPRSLFCSWARLLHKDLPQEEAHGTVKLKHMAVHGKRGTACWAEPASDEGPAREIPVSAIKRRHVECLCCLSDMGPDDVVALLPCGHVFHEECIVSWAVSGTTAADTCPLCRLSFRAAKDP
eukprot:gb/GFBE01001049.1/.p1 GENE.gb/GFBE01001049.1/~~gb/GFBE01001049.1/.p1  ORF type:complete len:388 (+),score=50.01 gb/GFBE01001049.1/:1-1164(+)